MKSPTICDLINANKVLLKIKENSMTMNFQSLRNLYNAVFKWYSDASLANVPSGNSTGGYVIFWVGENGESCPLVSKTKILCCAVVQFQLELAP